MRRISSQTGNSKSLYGRNSISMNAEELKKYVCSAAILLAEAIKKIDINSMGLLYVVDANNRLAGCLTDGDVRRWIIKNGGLDGRVEDAMNHNPKYVQQEDIDKSNEIMHAEQIYSIAVINNSYEITDIIFHKAYKRNSVILDSNALRDIPIIIMAGGKGTRLYPYTKILPKPLVPVGEVPILERILNHFYQFGAKEFYLTVNYRKEMIKSYFAETLPPYKINYIEEEQPLGTAGSIRLIKKKFDMPVVITNCDTMIEADYKKLLDYHKSSGNDMTLVASIKNILIPYGVLHTTAKGLITSMEEKPQLSHFINTGMYIVNPEFLNWIPENEAFHMTDLTQKMIDSGKQVGMYPISENSFLDMGEFEELKKMEERINSGYVE